MQNTQILRDPRRELALRLMGGAAPSRQNRPIPKRSPGTILPMTVEQRHVWLHTIGAPDRPIYNEPITIRYSGDFDYMAFLRSFDELLHRHEALRTSFSSLDENPVQIVHEDMHIAFPLIDLRKSHPDAREAEALAMAKADASTPLPLDEFPLFRGRIMKFAENDHRFYLTLHHIIFDGATLQNIFMPELTAIYEAYSRGVSHDLPAPSAQYGDYTVWQQANNPDHTAQLEYWRTTLSGDLPVLQLPVDRENPPRPTSDGGQQIIWIEEPIATGLKSLSNRLGVTSYITLLALLKTLFHRYSAQDDLIVGSIADTRRHADLQSMAGYCLNSIALRSRPSPTTRFSDYLLHVRDVVIRALENSDVPFEQVVRVVPSAAQKPIFRTMFSMQPQVRSHLPGWNLLQMEVHPDTTKFDLYVEIREHPSGAFEARFIYSRDLFDARTIMRMARHFAALANAVLENEHLPLVELPMLSDDEIEEIVAHSSGPERSIPATTIDGLIADACRRDPGGTAILWEDTRWTRVDLQARIDAFAARLRLAGVGPGSIVALCVTRCPDMVAAALAIMSTGAAYLPLDPSFPPARLTAIVSDAEPVLVITQKDIAAELPGWGIPILLRDALLPHTATPPARPVRDPEATAYIMYTSGSTGVPKGVEIRHRSAVNLLQSMAREPGFTDEDVLLAVTTPTFDISILEMFLPLAMGGTVAIAANADIAEPSRLADLVTRSGCTVMQATPATWRGLFSCGWAGVPGLRILCGGEALPRDLSETILACGMELWNVYGPTETTIWSSALRVKAGRRISIGRPIDNTSMKILDPAGRLQPINVPGDLYISGAGLARGYRDPALTKKAFVELPAFPGERLYRTGDIALLRRDGTFEWLGRADGQVKVRGYRIDLGDIEAALSSHPAVLLAAVKTFEEQPGQRGLIAYLVPRFPAPSPIALRDYLKASLPPYMVPARYLFLDEMPLSTNGKIDRKALPDAGSMALVVAPHDPPTGETEIRLAEIWREVLSVTEIDANDDFQDLGGHSLLAAKLMGRVGRIFGKHLPLSTLLHAPTLRKMAAVIDLDAPTPDPIRFVTIQDGTLCPLFWIDAVPNFRTGQYRSLMRSLDRDRPLLGLPVDLTRHGDLSATRDLTSLATDIADTLATHPAPTPRILGGWCNGGILALEVATQLHARGLPVDLLILLDAANPTTYRRRSTRMLNQAIQAVRLPANQRWPFIRELAGGYLARFRRRNWLTEGEEDALEELNQRFMRLVTAYQPQPYPGRTLLLQPREGGIDYTKGWRPILPQLITAEIDGGHVTMLDQQHAPSLAMEIEKAFDAVNADAIQFTRAGTA